MISILMYELTRCVVLKIVLLSTKCSTTWTNSNTIDELKLLNYATISISIFKIIAINYLNKMFVFNNSINIIITIVNRNFNDNRFNFNVNFFNFFNFVIRIIFIKINFFNNNFVKIINKQNIKFTNQLIIKSTIQTIKKINIQTFAHCLFH